MESHFNIDISCVCAIDNRFLHFLGVASGG